MKRHHIAGCALIGLLLYMVPALARQTAAQGTPSTCQHGQDLITIPEIRSENGRLRAEIAITSGKRTLWGSTGDSRCFPQDLRYFTGRNLLKNEPNNPAFAGGEPIPGPTLRARVGDLIQIRFLNQVDTQSFANTLDQESTTQSNTTGCDEVRSNTGLIYPNVAHGDLMPNCLHGSSTSNLHFHGTHTTPDTTGDNILLFVRPALRSGRNRSGISPSNAFVERHFAQIWADCERNGSPTRWEQLPMAWRRDQERLLKEYDRTAPFRGVNGNLPRDMHLWPANEHQIAAGVWPQYQIGAYPYCFRLADPKTNTMGQSPGTHWYHAHKHGSTALNVANGLTGVFVIEGQYDDDLRKVYGADFRDQVLIIQQLSSTPFPLLEQVTQGNQFKGPGSVPKPQLSVNGRLSPVVKMRPGEVQLWRIVNGAFRNAVQFRGFDRSGMNWRQIAQDGVQFKYENYNTVGTANAMFNMAPANRVDLLVQAPMQTGPYNLTVQGNEGLPTDPTNTPIKEAPVTLLTVSVEGDPVTPPEAFLTQSNFPGFPPALNDIPESDIHNWREVDFGSGHNLIDGKPFDQTQYSQIMRLNSAEEWKITNAAGDKAHPFHIHVNPFQITEVFQPNSGINTTNPSAPCYVNLIDPQTWKACAPLPAPFVWWDTFAIPTSATLPLDSKVCTSVKQCPAAIQPYLDQCPSNVCSVTIPGYFKMRSRFVDFTGTYVLHCHILIHEDRGMMQMVEVVTDKPPYVHK